ncbi:hypothetical protein [Alteribacter aurantiacus]|uniref:hypothetical protein n=1 Tax=Alteribacter aurantiacus TaxID=254410 RepID=UPI000400DE33|nr:hypothetical protein [Alteribacter aurantiacus]
MKQAMPFIIIAALVGGALLFFQDPAEEVVFDPYHSQHISLHDTTDWEVELFADHGEGNVPDVGVKLTYMGDPSDIRAYEFFYSSMNGLGGYYDQQLDVDQFDGEIIYRTECNFCQRDGEDPDTDMDSEIYRHHQEGDFVIYWETEEEIHVAREYFSYSDYMLDAIMEDMEEEAAD